jgi:L-threonylcarbamoyladenylate synthase
MVVRADDPGALAALVDILARGGVAVAPGDTMYGLVGIAPESEARLRRVKGRAEDKPFLLLVADSSWISRFTDMPIPQKLARHWPGPLTIVVPARAGGTVAVRVPDSPFLHDLLAAIGKPLYSTSVNRAGAPPLQTVEAMRRELESDVDLIFDAGDLPPGAPSTLLDITEKPYRVLRQGALSIPPEDLQ